MKISTKGRYALRMMLDLALCDKEEPVRLKDIAARQDINSVSMVICFLVFFINDMYGFINWKKIEKRQKNTPSVC